MNWIADDLRRRGMRSGTSTIAASTVPAAAIRARSRRGRGRRCACAPMRPKYHLDLRRWSRSAIRRAGISRCGSRRGGACRRQPVPARDPLPIAHVVASAACPTSEEIAQAPTMAAASRSYELVGAPGIARDLYADTSIPRFAPARRAPRSGQRARGSRSSPIGWRPTIRQAGAEATLHTVADTGHVELITPGTEAWSVTKRLIAAAFAATDR